MTTFFLIPLIGTRAITISLGILGLLGCALLVAAASASRRPVRLGVLAALLASQIATLPPARAEDSFDPQIRKNMLARKDGRIAHLETVYNDIFVTKEANLLTAELSMEGLALLPVADQSRGPRRSADAVFPNDEHRRDFSAGHQARAGARPRRRLDSGLSAALSP